MLYVECRVHFDLWRCACDTQFDCHSRLCDNFSYAFSLCTTSERILIDNAFWAYALHIDRNFTAVPFCKFNHWISATINFFYLFSISNSAYSEYWVRKHNQADWRWWRCQLAYDISISHWILNMYDGGGSIMLIIILPYLWIWLATHTHAQTHLWIAQIHSAPSCHLKYSKISNV